jgi:hypothetical protein
MPASGAVSHLLPLGEEWGEGLAWTTITTPLLVLVVARLVDGEEKKKKRR